MDFVFNHYVYHYQSKYYYIIKIVDVESHYSLQYNKNINGFVSD